MRWEGERKDGRETGKRSRPVGTAQSELSVSGSIQSQIPGAAACVPPANEAQRVLRY